jgi:hypothetical protein
MIGRETVVPPMFRLFILSKKWKSLAGYFPVYVSGQSKIADLDEKSKKKPLYGRKNLEG